VRDAVILNLSIGQFFSAGVLMISILQISNWFTRKNINKTLALFILSQFAAYMTPCKWFDTLYYSVLPIVYYLCGSAFFIISVIDYYFFAFHPLEKNIFLDQDYYEKIDLLSKSVEV